MREETWPRVLVKASIWYFKEDMDLRCLRHGLKFQVVYFKKKTWSRVPVKMLQVQVTVMQGETWTELLKSLEY